MSGERYDLFRLYLVNMEQQRVTKRAFALALVVLGVFLTAYAFLVAKNISGLWVIYLFLLMVYFLLGEFIVGAMVYGPPKRIIKWAVKQKAPLPKASDAGELAAGAAKHLRNGNFTGCRQLLDQFFSLKNVAASWVGFGNTILADLQRTEGDPEAAVKTLKNNVFRKKRQAGCLSMLVFGRALLQQGELEKAIEALEGANEYFLNRDYGIPGLFSSRFKNSEMKNLYKDTLEVFVPFYLGKAYWATGKRPEEAGKYLKSALVLCRNRNLRPLLKEDFQEKE